MRRSPSVSYFPLPAWELATPTVEARISSVNVRSRATLLMALAILSSPSNCCDPSFNQEATSFHNRSSGGGDPEGVGRRRSRRAAQGHRTRNISSLNQSR